MKQATVRYCRVCGEALGWSTKAKACKPCRNGCSQVTAALSSDSESVATFGSKDDGTPVPGHAYRRGKTND